MGTEAYVKQYEAACGSKGTTTAAMKRYRDDALTRMDSLDGCTKQKMCDVLDGSNSATSIFKLSGAEDDNCCLNQFMELHGKGIFFDVCGSVVGDKVDKLTAA